MGLECAARHWYILVSDVQQVLAWLVGHVLYCIGAVAVVYDGTQVAFATRACQFALNFADTCVGNGASVHCEFGGRLDKVT